MQQQRQQQRPQATTLSTVLQLRSSDLTTTEGAWRLLEEVTRRRPDSIKSRMLSWLFLSTRDDAMNHQVKVNLNYRTFILINRQYSRDSNTERIWIFNCRWHSVFNGVQFLNCRHFVWIPNGVTYKFVTTTNTFNCHNTIEFIYKTTKVKATILNGSVFKWSFKNWNIQLPTFKTFRIRMAFGFPSSVFEPRLFWLFSKNWHFLN